jgi:ElaB/YqjD/DUF883 family membrane-anchored ribosome-binding protein
MIKNIERTQGGVDAMIDRTREAVVAATDRAEQGIESVAGRVVEKVHDAGEKIRTSADSATAGAHRGVADAAQAIDRGYNRAKSDLSCAAARATDYVTSHPGKSLLLVASAGFLLGLLVRGRRASA